MLGTFEASLFTVLDLGAFALAVWGLVDAATRPAAYFAAAGKLTKPAWTAILAAAALVLFLTGFLGLLGIVGTVAAIVYLVDVRPALQALKPGSGPYG